MANALPGPPGPGPGGPPLGGPGPGGGPLGPGPGLGGPPPPPLPGGAPELDPTALASGIALLAGGMIVLRERRKNG
ncbi:MAG TPA: hypothetical protein VMU41_13640 [Candidatus Binataceae bacterium]|nr:hypothetical protein [Candidatus Binataceae bacterium]